MLSLPPQHLQTQPVWRVGEGQAEAAHLQAQVYWKAKDGGSTSTPRCKASRCAIGPAPQGATWAPALAHHTLTPQPAVLGTCPKLRSAAPCQGGYLRFPLFSAGLAWPCAVPLAQGCLTEACAWVGGEGGTESSKRAFGVQTAGLSAASRMPQQSLAAASPGRALQARAKGCAPPACATCRTGILLGWVSRGALVKPRQQTAGQRAPPCDWAVQAPAQKWFITASDPQPTVHETWRSGS